jgi:hypothetical protein
MYDIPRGQGWDEYGSWAGHHHHGGGGYGGYGGGYYDGYGGYGYGDYGEFVPVQKADCSQ